jgi:hypothetical protein
MSFSPNKLSDGEVNLRIKAKPEEDPYQPLLGLWQDRLEVIYFSRVGALFNHIQIMRRIQS